jgi:hypothetical protein
MYVCVYVCMFACTYVCLYVCMYVCTQLHIHVWMYLCKCTYVCIYVSMHACMYVYMYLCTYVWMYMYSYMYAYKYVELHEWLKDVICYAAVMSQKRKFCSQEVMALLILFWLSQFFSLYIFYLTRCNQPFVTFPFPQENCLYAWWLYWPVRRGLWDLEA